MKPLSGVRILDFTHGVAGPVTTMILADLGADVVKIEKPERGDPSRYMNVSDRFVGDIPASGGDYFLAINRNKRSVGLDLHSERGQELAQGLIAWADVIVQNFRPGVMERLGLDYAHAREINPTTIYASLSAYGETGPLGGHPGMDVAVQARSGVMSITGYEGSDPVKPGSSLADFSGGTHLAVAILAAIVYRDRTGEGQEINVNLLDSTMAMLANYSVATLDGEADIKPMGSGHPQLVPFQAFPASDGHIVIATGTNKLFRTFCDVLKRPELAQDPRYKSNPSRVTNRVALVEILSEVTRQRSVAEWLETFEGAGIPCAPVNDLSTAFRQPQLVENGMIVEVDHPTYGTIHVLGVPYNFSVSKCAVESPPPLLGEHTREVLAEILGLDADETDALVTHPAS
jgi:crotonobetainyl-CoA:carnitine CoA-transferase CaiB-like acyl-CoA transferase